MNFEQVNNHVSNLSLPAIDPIAAEQQLCTYYQAVKPILALVESFPFFPSNWKPVIAGFTQILDSICTQK